MIPFWSPGCMGSKGSRAIAKVGRHLERISEVQYTFSLGKITPDVAAAGMFKEVEGIRSRYLAIPDTAAIKEPLRVFLDEWNTLERIETSLRDDRQEFMIEVNGFYLRGYVTKRDGSRTLFPIMRP